MVFREIILQRNKRIYQYVPTLLTIVNGDRSWLSRRCMTGSQINIQTSNKYFFVCFTFHTLHTQSKQKWNNSRLLKTQTRWEHRYKVLIYENVSLNNYYRHLYRVQLWKWINLKSTEEREKWTKIILKMGKEWGEKLLQALIFLSVATAVMQVS